MNLIPALETVMQILQKTNAYRFGHFVSEKKRYSSHYFKIPMTFHDSDNAKFLADDSSRKRAVQRLKKSSNSKISNSFIR